MDRPPIEIARCCFQPAKKNEIQKKERRPHLGTLEAKVENNDSQGGKNADGTSIVGVHTPLHPTHLHLLFLDEHLKASAVRIPGVMGFRTWPLTGASGSKVERFLLRLLLTPSLGENLSMSVNSVVTDFCETRLSCLINRSRPIVPIHL